MKSLVLLAALSLPLAACGTMKDNQPPALTGKEAKTLADALKDRVPGKPIQCLSTFNMNEMTPVTDSIILYRDGRTVYRNDLRGSCNGLANGDSIMVERLYGAQACDGDIIHMVDRVSRMTTGSCGFGQFIPYEKRR